MANKTTNMMALDYVLENCALPTEIREKFVTMKEQLVKKASHVSEADKAKAEMNEKIKALILTNLEFSKKYTATEVGTLLTPLVGENISNQKASHLLNEMTAEIGKTVEKRITYFFLKEQ